MRTITVINLFVGLLIFTACSSTYMPNPDTSKGEVIGMDRNSDVKISYVAPRYFEDWQTRSIGEALTGQEYTYGHLTLRSQPDAREGMYFFIMFDWSADDILMASTIELHVDSTETPKARKYIFTIPETHSILREVKLGLTGTDWKGKNERVNAWKVVVRTPSGKIVTQKQSWLWGINGDGKVVEK